MKHEFILKDLIEPAMRRYNFDSSITSQRVTQAYEATVGEFITKMTRSLRYDVATHTLYLTPASPALKNELSYKTTDLIAALNRHIGKEEVRRIVLC